MFSFPLFRTQPKSFKDRLRYRKIGYLLELIFFFMTFILTVLFKVLELLLGLSPTQAADVVKFTWCMPLEAGWARSKSVNYK